MTINFTKATASGNDFVLIDYRFEKWPFQLSDFIKKACDRKFGIGADGVILIENDTEHDFLMRYFNADGSGGSLCGNGARCSAKFMSEKINKKNVKFRAVGKTYRADILETTVKLYLPDLEKKLGEYDFSLNDNTLHGYFIDTGSPHIVIFEDMFPARTVLEKLDVYKFGKEIRYHSLLSPQGANVNFVKINDEHSIRIRTYERGVEDETLACGTGSIASAIISVLVRNRKTPISVFTQGGDEFRVDFKITDEYLTELSLEGSAQMVFDGSCYYDEKNNILIHK
jgi:diaminopimelate epimerase